MPRRQKKVCEDLLAMPDDETSMPAEAPKRKAKKPICLKTLQKSLIEVLHELEQLRNPPDINAEHAKMLKELEMFKKQKDAAEDEFQSFLLRMEHICDPPDHDVTEFLTSLVAQMITRH